MSYSQTYYQEHKELWYERNKAWRQNNLERSRMLGREWARKHSRQVNETKNKLRLKTKLQAIKYKGGNVLTADLKISVDMKCLILTI